MRAVERGRRYWSDLERWWEDLRVPVARLPGFGGAAFFLRTHLRPAVGVRGDTAHLAVDIGVMGPTFRRFYMGRRVAADLPARLSIYFMAAASDDHPDVTLAAFEDASAGVVIAVVSSTADQVTLEVTIVEDLDDEVREFEVLNFETTRAALVSAAHDVGAAALFEGPTTVFGSSRRGAPWVMDTFGRDDVGDDTERTAVRRRPSPLLHAMYPFPSFSRMSSVLVNTPTGASENDVVLFSFIDLAPDQDPAVEWDALGSHVPYQVAGFYGTYADGNPWMVVIQKGPADLFDESLIPPEDPPPSWWSPLVASGEAALVDGLARALWFNHDAELVNATHGGPGILYGDREGGDCFWCIEDLRLAYEQVGVDAGAITSWTVTELVWGLLAESCNVPLDTVVTGYAGRCAFPDEDHECEYDVFRDVFAAWDSGRLRRPEPDLDAMIEQDDLDDDDGMTLEQFDEMLATMSKGELREMAVLNGLGKSNTKGLGKSALIDLLRSLFE